LAAANKGLADLKKDNGNLKANLMTVQTTMQQQEEKEKKASTGDVLFRYLLIAAENERLGNVIITMKNDMEAKLRELERSLEEMREREKKL